MDIWMWSIDCWTAKKLMLMCRPTFVEMVDFAKSRLPQILAILFLDVVFNENFV